MYNELIIGSGGIKGISIAGVILELDYHVPLNKFKYYTGCSVGSLICLLIIIGYTKKEIYDLIYNIDFSEFQELKIINLIENYGLDKGIKLNNFYKALILNKNINTNITFLELYKKTNKIFTCVSVNITKGICEYHNYINNPNMSVLLAIKMSTNIPIVFSPILYNDNYYIDGAFLDPVPYNYNKNTKKICIAILFNYEYDFLKNNVKFVNNVNNTFEYTFELLKILYLNYNKKIYQKIKNMIYLNFDIDIDLVSFKLSNNVKDYMINIGIKKTKKFFYKIYLKKRKKYLTYKYFKLWYNYIFTGAALSGACSETPLTVSKY
jgi:predicted acylesterase/phospholipase RssA